MVILHQSSTKAEQERIEATFKTGVVMCKAALATLLYALIAFLLTIVHIFTFVINLCIGILMCLNALVCAMRLLFIQCQELLENPMNTIEGRNRW